MKHIIYLLIFAGFFSFKSVKAQCIEITSILINACNPTSDEEDNEMVTFSVGSTPLDTANLNVIWPNISFNGFCASASATAGLNATITNGCGFLLEPPGGIIPANANVILITSDNVSTIDNSFSGLADTLYVIYQCDGGSTAQFVNSSGTGTRTTTFSISGPCSQVESVTYDRQFITNTDGERVNFDAVGNATYDNTSGCVAPVLSYSAAWTFANGGSYNGEICNDYGVVDLSTLLSAGATLGGTWTGPRVAGNNYDPTGYVGIDSVTYSIIGSGTCTQNLDSTMVFDVVTPQSGTATAQSCDSAFVNGTWYSSSTTFTQNIPASYTYSCDSSVDYSIIIDNAITDSTYLSSCNPIMFNGVTYVADIILRDTIFGGGGGPIVIDTILKTGFEDAEGWMDQASGNWMQVDAFGTWTANDMYANQFNPNNGIRNVGMNDVGDYLEIPPLSNPQTLYYFDRLSSAAAATNELAVQYFDGTTWQTIATDICTHLNYELVTTDLSSISGLANVSLRIFRTQDDRSAYIDDIVIVGSTSASVSTCDSITVTNIDILDPITMQNPANPIVICSINDSTQLADGSFVYTAGTYPILYPNASAAGCDSTYTTLVQTQSCDFTCNFDTVLYDSFEYTGPIPGLVPGSTFHPNPINAVPPTFGGMAHSGDYIFYMNFQNGYSGPVYSRTIDVCEGADFRYSFWIRQYGNGLGSDVDINIFDGSGLTGTLLYNQNIVNNGTTYNQIVSPSITAQSNQITFQLITNTPGASGNDLILDDFVLEVCQIETLCLASQNYCTGDLPENLYNFVSSTLGTNGTWNGPSVLGNGQLGTFNPATDNFGTYYYTVPSPIACSDTTVSIEIIASPIPTPNIGADLIICQGTDTLLDATTANASYLWQDGTTTTPTFSASTTGTYFVDVTVNNCTGRDSLELTVNAVSIVNETASICAGDSLFLENNWQTQAGVYTDTYQTSSNCDSIINTTLTILNVITFDSLIEVCSNEVPVTIFGNSESQAGIYSETIPSSLGCDSVISNIELVINDLPNVSLGANDTITQGDNLVLNVINPSSNDTYSWTNSLGETFSGESITANSSESANYILTSINQFSCSESDSLYVFVNPIDQTFLLIPDAFSPNGDGVNDLFKIANFEDYKSYTLKVYNRWGELVFDNQGYNVAWDGTYQGEAQNVAAYVFYIIAEPLNGGEVMKFSGSVSLVR